MKVYIFVASNIEENYVYITNKYCTLKITMLLNKSM